MLDPKQSRAQMLMLLAAEYIRENAPGYIVHYDEADCDGYCLADDLKIEAEEDYGTEIDRGGRRDALDEAEKAIRACSSLDENGYVCEKATAIAAIRKLA